MIAMSCVATASVNYAVTPAAIEAVISKPASAGGIGPMHIPAAWLNILARVGFAPAKVIHDECTNIEAGAWVMAFDQMQSGLKAAAPETSPPPVLPADAKASAWHSDVTAACIEGAARFYHLPVALFSAVLRTEGGTVGQIHRNANGSYDMGPAQINSTWLPTLARAGISRSMVLNNGCLNVSLGAWILGQAMAGADPHDPAQYWQHVGDYNSHTPKLNEKYAYKVWNNLKR